MRSSSRMCADASRTGRWCAHHTRCQIMPGRGGGGWAGQEHGRVGVAALTRGFFSFPPQDPTDGQKKELLKGIEAYEDDKGHQQYRITKVEVRRATRGVQAPRSCLSFGQTLRAHSVATCTASLACVSSCEDFSGCRGAWFHVPSWRAAQCLSRGLGWLGRQRGTPCCRPALRASAA